MFGKWGVAKRVAGPLKADDETITDELVISRPDRRGDILDAHVSARESCKRNKKNY